MGCGVGWRGGAGGSVDLELLIELSISGFGGRYFLDDLYAFLQSLFD